MIKESKEISSKKQNLIHEKDCIGEQYAHS